MAYKNLRWPLLLSVAAAVLTIGMKSAAYLFTGSVGLLSDALESGVNLLAALAATFSLWYANQPADSDHPFGHEKIEFFSSGLEGALVFVAGIVTIWFGVERLIRPHELEQLGVGTVLAVVASAVNFAVAVVLLRVGKRYNSIILEADGHHLMTDVLTSVGVVVGLVLVWLTGWHVLDPLLAIAVGLHILFTGFKLVRRSFDGLMDRALPEADQATIREVIRQALPAGADFHLLRTREAGRRKFLEFHLLVEGSRSVREGHAIAHHIEEKLLASLPEVTVTIHVEPIDEKSSFETQEMQNLGEAK